MTVKFEDRPLDSVKDEAVDQLVMNYGHGKISLEAFDRRVDEVMASKSHERILILTADLELKVDKNFEQMKRQEMTMRSDLEQSEESKNNQDIEKIYNILSSNERSGRWRVPRELHITDVLSGGSIDLTNAQFAHQTTKINIFSTLSDITIFVPEDINVCVNVFSIIGSVKNKAPSLHDSSSPTVVIEGFSILSSVSIKVKRNFKEKVMRFADGIKKALN